MGSLAIYLYFESSIPDNLGWFPLVCIIGSFIGYSVGYASIPFCNMGEILPLRSVSFIGYSVGYATIPFCIMGEILPVRLVSLFIGSSET